LNLALLKKIKPKFWDHHDVAAGTDHRHFNFRRKWRLVVVLTTVVALIPLIAGSLINYSITRDAIESELLQRTSKLLTATWRTFSFFLTERKSALEFVLRDNTVSELADSGRLSVILTNLQHGLGGFVDIGMVDASGNQIAYAGPKKFKGMNYCEEKCFKQVLLRGFYISELDPEDNPQRHVAMAIKQNLPDGSFFVLRATLNIKAFSNLLNQLELGEKGDAFIINHTGILQTTSRLFGNALEKAGLSVPGYSEKPQVIRDRNSRAPFIIGYAYIPKTSFILMIAQPEKALMKPWHVMRMKLLGLLALCVAVMLIAILCMATYLVHRIHAADQKRVIALHQAEYANKMATIGRLAAGVAHEVNNPLAVINEKAGLLKDLMAFDPQHARNDKWLGIVDDILSTVNRCGTVTRRLLNFARHTSVKIERLNLVEIIHETLALLSNEAEYRGIRFSVTAPENMPLIESNRGSLEQILLNLLNNAFAAMNSGGHLELAVNQVADGHVTLKIADNGCGIAAEDLKNIFDPFFTTKSRQGSTGLGLSVTYGLVNELGGSIEVFSEVGQGTQFEISLPLKMGIKELNDAYYF
jgi:signal transduction histidine kinase